MVGYLITALPEFSAKGVGERILKIGLAFGKVKGKSRLSYNSNFGNSLSRRLIEIIVVGCVILILKIQQNTFSGRPLR